MKKVIREAKQIPPYNPADIESKWQKKWSASKLYKSKEDSKKPKYYVLDMFPYPSGEGLHVGHPKGYIATDIISRYRRMKGYSVLHPMGFDAFGLPAENYALKTKTNPADSVKENVARFKKQLEIIGLDYDWSREINTTDPEYYRWTQWIFLQLFKKGLAYQSYEPINWCPSCKTGLANEDVEDGRCERCGTPVEKKPMRQWVLKITDYAEKLLNDLDAIDTSSFPHIIDKKWPPRPGKKEVTRRTIHALVRDPKTGKFLGLKWKKFPWITFIVGGVEKGEDIIEAAKREVLEETGYSDLKFTRILGEPVKAEYFAAHKDQNRVAITTGILFELVSDKRSEVAQEEKEMHETIWMDPKDMISEIMTCAELPVWLKELKDGSTGHDSAEARPFLDWPESIKEAQRNWIGKSEGALIKFRFVIPAKAIQQNRASVPGIQGQKDDFVEVFTTRPDTLFGVTYVVLAPEHKLIAELLNTIENKKEVEDYTNRAKNESEMERTDAKKEKTGVELKGVKAINPANNEEVPVWIADYVLADYGTGAVMAVPAHDERDWAFAKKFGLAVKSVIVPFDTIALSTRPVSSETVDKMVEVSIEKQGPILSNGKVINSDKFNGRDSNSIKKEITESVGGKWVTKYKIRDWVFSRQRYWGEPIPLIHCESCALKDPAGQGVVPVPEKDLPVVLPEVKSYEPTGTGESPLAAISEWVNVKCPVCKGPAKRETNTMPQWAGSSWYYLRYEDPKNKKQLVDVKKEKYWSPVDIYVGGAEHATRHLIYARFWHKFLHDIGVTSTIEPFKKLQHVGLIMGEDGRKMSKRFGNVINPDDVIKTYGADTLRIYEMFMGPFDQQITWNTSSIIGARRFIERLWKMSERVPLGKDSNGRNRLIHKTIKKVTEDIENMRFNTAISTLMIMVNEFEGQQSIDKETYEILLKLLAPFAPHVTEELWSMMGNKGSVNTSEWPSYDPTMIVDDEKKIMVQVNGKLRGSFVVESENSDDELKKKAFDLPEVKKWIDGKEIKKVIVVKGRLVSIVLG